MWRKKILCIIFHLLYLSSKTSGRNRSQTETTHKLGVCGGWGKNAIPDPLVGDKERYRSPKSFRITDAGEVLNYNWPNHDRHESAVTNGN